MVTRRHSVRARSGDETRYAVPITSDGSAAFIRFVQTTGKELVYHFITYRQDASLRFENAAVALHAERLDEAKNLVFSCSLNLESRPDKELFDGFVVADLDRGFYRADIQISDVAPAVWLARRSDPIVVALFENVADLEDGREKALAWHPMIGESLKTPVPTDVERPAVEAYLSPFWATVPFGHRMRIDFEIDETQTLYFAVAYSGEHQLTMKSIDLYERSFTKALDGSAYVLPKKPAGW